jgi:hypothetical protein
MFVYKGHLIGFPADDLVSAPVYRILYQQMRSSLQLISQGTKVEVERAKLHKVSNSFLDHTCKRQNPIVFDLEDSEFQKCLETLEQLPLSERFPWLNSYDASTATGISLDQYTDHLFAFVPTHTSRLDTAYATTGSRQQNHSAIPTLTQTAARNAAGRLQWALKQNCPMPTVGLGHNKIIEALHQHVYSQDETSEDPHNPRHIALTYDDGSIGSDISLAARNPITPETKPFNQKLNLGLVSARHLGIDDEVDFYLLRSKNITNIGRQYSFAEQERTTYLAFSDLAESLMKQGSLSITLFASGLQPANAGLVRSVLDILHTSPPQQFELRFMTYNEKEYDKTRFLHFL